MALSDIAEEYFRTLNPLATRIQQDIDETRDAYENIWDTLTDKEKAEIIDESIIKPEIAVKYALLEPLDFDLNDPPLRKGNLMSFFAGEYAQRIVHDENGSYRDEFSAPFLYQTKSQLNLCIYAKNRQSEEKPPSSPPPVKSELEISHSKVVDELKNALKSHDKLKPYKEKDRDVTSPTGFLTKFMGNFRTKDDEDREFLVGSGNQNQIVASSDNFFKTGFKSPLTESKYEKDYRNSMAKSNSDLSEENRGLLASSQASSGTDFQSSETLTETMTLPKTGFDFLDNW